MASGWSLLSDAPDIPAVQYCDLAQDAQLALTVWQIQLGKPVAAAGRGDAAALQQEGPLEERAPGAASMARARG